ncbi:MAG: hypothetical protein OEN50_02275 [Deltaproteobacteria bacterium]|nr:hypothetical protein [Deltaproteobacteria bacterium]
MKIMKTEMPFLAALVLLGTDLMARVAVQGVEQALFSTVIDWAMLRVKMRRQNFISGSRRVRQ